MVRNTLEEQKEDGIEILAQIIIVLDEQKDSELNI
jgi:hypothetical protein